MDSIRSLTWDFAVHSAIRGISFEIADVPARKGERHIARKTLQDLKELGWIYQNSDRDRKFKPGPMAAKYSYPESSREEEGEVEENRDGEKVSAPNEFHSCPICDQPLSHKHRTEGPEHPEVGWVYYDCPSCDTTLSPNRLNRSN